MNIFWNTMAVCGLSIMLATPAASAADTDHQTGGHMQGMAMSSGPKGDSGPASLAFAKANARMHEAMDITFTGDADMDFARSMIAHHQGAIDMARIELEHGKDPKMRKLAEHIVAAQESEIGMMKDWLEKRAR